MPYQPDRTEVYLVGAGPGDPDLLTVKAHRLLGRADVVLHDSLIDPRVLRLARSGAELIDVGKRCGSQSADQGEICRLLVSAAQAGGVVVRLKGGDPMIFGRATEELDALAVAGFDAEVVPGITTAVAAAASLRLSLTRRKIARTLHIITGHGAEGGLPAHDWVSLARAGGTFAVYMGGRTLRGLATHLIEAGTPPDLPAIAVVNVSLPDERRIIATLATLPGLLDRGAGNDPVVVLIGEALAEDAGVALSGAACAAPTSNVMHRRPKAFAAMVPAAQVHCDEPLKGLPAILPRQG